jgi:hypothetical protein
MDQLYAVLNSPPNTALVAKLVDGAVRRAVSVQTGDVVAQFQKVAVVPNALVVTYDR